MISLRAHINLLLVFFFSVVFSTASISDQFESTCWRIVMRHGHDSAQFNNGVNRPSARGWDLVKSNKPWFGDTEIEYFFKQITRDGFEHGFKCELTSAGWYGSVYVEGHGYAFTCGEGLSTGC